jgi:hypothetical protein
MLEFCSPVVIIATTAFESLFFVYFSLRAIFYLRIHECFLGAGVRVVWEWVMLLRRVLEMV